MDNLEQRFEAVSAWLTAIDTFSSLFLGLALLGILYDFIRKKRYSYKEVKANLIIGAVNSLLNMTGYGMIFILTLWLSEQIAITKIPTNTYTWIMALILADFSYYWMHRIEHRVRFLWAIHAVHHSSTEFDLTTGLRLAWLESLFEWVFFVPMILLGFDLVQVVVSILLVVAYQTWIHTEHIKKLGWLDKIVNTPANHRVHHGSNPHYIDKNFGGILMLWDKFFGTYQAEDEQVNYGLTKNIGTANPIKINFHEWQSLFKDISDAKTAKEKWLLLVKPPEWKLNSL